METGYDGGGNDGGDSSGGYSDGNDFDDGESEEDLRNKRRGINGRHAGSTRNGRCRQRKKLCDIMRQKCLRRQLVVGELSG